MGESNFLAHPCSSGLRIASVSRISNAASPRQVIIYTTNGYTIIIYSISGDITHPRKRFRCITSVIQIQSCEV